MKKYFSILLAMLLILSALAACDQGSKPTETTDAETEAPTKQETTTQAATEAPTVPEVTESPTTEAPATTEPATEAPSAEETSAEQDTTEDPTAEVPTAEDPTEQPSDEAPSDPEQTTAEESEYPYEVIDIPVGFYGDTMLQGYNASGVFYYDEEYNCLCSDEDNNMIIVTNDTMEAGTLSATFLSTPGYINDNGIIFGMEESPEDEYYFWEYGPAYYFLFISDIQHLYLAKAGFNGQAWTELEVTENPVTDYVHGETPITITVEFDGQGTIKCYANDELLIDYFDDEPITGNRYGVRCEVAFVEYYNILAEHD